MRIPVSAPQNIFFDSQQIDDTNLTLEQNYNNQIQSGIIANHIGSGVLPTNLVPHILFDSNLTSGFTDGVATNVQAQPYDSNFGAQLEIELSSSNATGKRAVKLLIVGLDFENNLQYDTFTFNKNEKQISSKHYKIILTLLTNDFTGQATQSFNLGGRIVIREAGPATLSRDCIMIAQDVQPNLFFRDFFTPTGTISTTLAAALPSYNTDGLNITVGYSQLRTLLVNDVSSQIGQKFLASTNNIQKISLLLSVASSNGNPLDLAWTGQLQVSIYPLQSSVSCQTDITPNLAIQFDPANVPLAQFSFNYNDFLSRGIKLDTVPQPVDFIFSNTPVGSGLVITPGNYYLVAIKRSGSADNGQIQVAVGTNSSSITRETLFNGSIWTDVPGEAIWFQVWTDAAKISDGQAYDAGHGVQIPKTIINPATGLTEDYSMGSIQFVRNDLYYALLQAITKDSALIQDDRTGNNVYSQQQFYPSVSLLNSAALANIQNVSDPLIIGAISDGNIKANVSGLTINALMHEYGMVDNQIVLKVITDPTDGYRYDQNIIELVSELVSGNLNGAKFIPNTANPSVYYRIAKAELLTMMYGDINGDGVIDVNDLMLAKHLNGSDLNYIPTYNQYVEQTSYFTANGYVAWQIVDPATLTILSSGVDGYIIPNPLDGTIATLSSASANFASIMNLDGYNAVISASTFKGNNGTFAISSLINAHNITINKVYYTSDTILQILRGDISTDMVLDNTDTYYITNYVQAVPPFPATTPPGNRIGTQFQAIRLTVEEYIDRADDYPYNVADRSTVLHTVPDIYLDGYSSFAGRNLKTSPLQFSIVKQLVWDSSNIVVNSHPRMVSAAFTYQNGFIHNSCKVPGVLSSTYPAASAFDPGKNDLFVPNNLVVNFDGQLVRPDGYFMKLDFETNSIVIEIPDVPFDMEHTINLLSDFIADTGNGYTITGYPAMRFADCSTVDYNALLNNQLRFSVAVQSFSPQINGLDPSCISGIIVDGKIGVSMNYQTGLLTLNFTNLYQDPVKQTLNTKVEITVYLKKAGWNNTPIYVNSVKAQNILGVPNPPPSSIIC
jgi:hypothetical protein